MKTIHVNQVVEAISEACIRINQVISVDMRAALASASEKESSEIGRSILQDLIKNSEIAKSKHLPICQDTGMVVAFVTLGQDVRIDGGSLNEAIQSGVRLGYERGYLRKSVVRSPLERKNTNDNTPAIVYYDLVLGDVFKIEIAAKGFGSENMSKSAMLKPSDGVEGVKKFVLETVKAAGSNPCPPIIVGVGIGGTLDKAAQIAKHALYRDVGSCNEDPELDILEKAWLCEVNQLNIGPQGFGGLTTALGLHIETFPTHIAGLPVVVNINCHASRHDVIEF